MLLIPIILVVIDCYKQKITSEIKCAFFKHCRKEIVNKFRNPMNMVSVKFLDT